MSSFYLVVFACDFLSLSEKTASIASQGNYRIDFHGPQRRQPAGDERHRQEQERDHGKSQRIGRATPSSKAFIKPVVA